MELDLNSSKFHFLFEVENKFSNSYVMDIEHRYIEHQYNLCRFFLSRNSRQESYEGSFKRSQNITQ